MDVISCNGIVYIGYTEEWKEITYRDIVRGKYEVSNLGRFRKIRNGKYMYGCNSKNEKGYHRIALKSMSGKIKKYAMHRIIVYQFLNIDPEEVNHLDGNPHNNALYNLEPSDRSLNAQHAALNNLYQSCDNHYRAQFTNEQVEQICKFLSEGKPVSEIISKMNLSNKKYVYSNIDKIINRKSWVRISSKYTFDYKKYHYKTYAYEDIEKMCECIFIKKMKNSEIVKLFPQYNTKNLKNALKGMRARKLYKPIIDKYI